MQPLSVGVVTNVEATVNRDAARVKPLLVEQVVAPVRWHESVRTLVEVGCEYAVELGPGRVLSGLIRRIDRRVRNFHVEAPADVDKLVMELGA